MKTIAYSALWLVLALPVVSLTNGAATAAETPVLISKPHANIVLVGEREEREHREHCEHVRKECSEKHHGHEVRECIEREHC